MLENLKQQSQTIWAEFVDGFEIEVRYRTREQIGAMLTSARASTWDSKTNAVVEAFDADKYRELLARETIVGWRGLTPEVLQKLVLLESYPDSEIPYSVADAAWLLKETKLDLWLQNLCTAVEAFRAARRAEATKNLSPSHADS